jgi:osmoprotectant transport system permease protein
VRHGLETAAIHVDFFVLPGGDVVNEARVNRIALLGGLIGTLSVALLPLLILKPNRLLAGKGVSALSFGLEGWALLTLFVAATALSLLPVKTRGWLLALFGNAILILSSLVVGSRATALTAGNALARVSPDGASWLGWLGAGLLIYGGLNAWRDARVVRLVLSSLGVGFIAVFIAFGGWSNLSVLREYATNQNIFWSQLLQHAILTFSALLLSSLIGLPLGAWASRQPRVAAATIAVSSALQTVPSVALLTLLIAPYSALARAVPALEAIGIRGIGPAPALTALTLYGLLPIVRGVLNGLGSVDKAALEAARGMGMTGSQMFWRVAVPLAVPLTLEGLRLSAVNLVGLSALSSLVGAGGLGFFIFSGLGSGALDLVLLGAIPTLLLALMANAGFSGLERVLTPKGLR